MPNYNLGPIKFCSFMAMFWGIAGFTVGLLHRLAAGLSGAEFRPPWINFGRLRPLHTSAVVFAFGGNVLLATSFYVVQKTCAGAARRRSRALVRGRSATTSSS